MRIEWQKEKQDLMKSTRNSNALVIVQARVGSTRLPANIALDFNGVPMLVSLLNRLNISESKFHGVVATSLEKRDDLVEELALSCGWGVHRGSESDVLSRYAGAYAEHGEGVETVIRICSDNPLLGLHEIEEVYARFRDSEMDFLANANGPDVHEDGFAVEVFYSSCLIEADKKATEAYDREHVCPWIKRNYAMDYTQLDGRYKEKLSVDTVEDFLRVRELNKRLQPGFTISDVCDLIIKERK